VNRSSAGLAARAGRRALLLGIAAVLTYGQEGGTAEVALQGYYLGGGSQNVLDTTGVAVKFQEFLPQFGLLRGSLEGYHTDGSIRPGDNFLELRGLVRRGLRWDLTGGDFHVIPSVVQNPFNNLFFPEINARGVQIEASDSRSAYTFFYGQETLLGGPRIPFRVDVPQTVLGASVRQRFGRLETGVRILHLSTKQHDTEEDSFLFPAGRRFLSADNLTVYTAYTFSDHFRWYGEATAARVQSIEAQPAGQPVSYFFGPAWESPRLTVRANYADLAPSYFPVAGYLVGDRKGPYGEVRIRPVHRLELFGSASRYETTQKQDPVVPFMRSTGTAAGASVELPLRFSASAQLSTLHFCSSDPKSGATQDSQNRQLTGTLSRQFGRQTLRLTARDMRLTNSGLPDRERSGEVEDTLQFGRVVVGGAVRAQQSFALERRNSVYFRGSAQINLGRLTAYGYFEGGKDLVNQTVFATNTASSSVLSATLSLTQRWSIQGEAYRSRLIASLNPENLFVEGNQGVFVNPVLSRFDQWSFLFKIARSFTWGSALPAGGLDQYTRQRIPLVGSVEGFAHVVSAEGPRPAPGVAINLENGRSATTDVNGRYRFEGVPEGPHTVSINMEELPAEYNPGENIKSLVSVRSSKVTRADLDLRALSAFVGMIAVSSGPAFDSLEGIVIRLSPGDRYTTTLQDGSFAFYNLPDGDYEVGIAVDTLPPLARLKSAPNAAVVVRAGSASAVVQFEIERRPIETKPVRKVLEERIESLSFPLGEPRGVLPKFEGEPARGAVANDLHTPTEVATPEVRKPVAAHPDHPPKPKERPSQKKAGAGVASASAAPAPPTPKATSHARGVARRPAGSRVRRGPQHPRTGTAPSGQVSGSH
jgi:hypothetical protein